MKISALNQSSVRGFTIPETITAVGIFMLLVAAVVSTQVFGLRMYKISETKLSTTDDARSALNRIRGEVWSSRKFQVGKGDAYSFVPSPANSPQRGNAIRIFASDNTNNYVSYYVDTTDTCLKRQTSGVKRLEIVADYVTNQFGFQVEDFQGNVVSNALSNNRVVRMSLQFFKPEYSITGKGQNKAVWMGESYQLQTKMTRRTIE